MAAFDVTNGSLDDVDLSGTTFAFVNLFPSNLSAGNWKFGVIVDEGASDEQASAIERIMKGEEGGPFADFAPLISDWLGMERGSVSVSNGETPSASVSGVDFTFEPLPGPEGGHTTVKNAMFGFAPEYRVGKSPTKSTLFGLDFDAVYSETADYEFASEMAEGAPKGRI